MDSSEKHDASRNSLSARLMSTDHESPHVERVITAFNSTIDTKQFPVNCIVTSRYTWLNFLPKAMFEQFRRLANVYFLVIGIIAVIGTYTSYYYTAVEPAGILLPMTVVVMISVVKDGLEDVKRHNTDTNINALPARRVLLDGSVETVRWRELVVGSVVLLLCDDSIPADVVVVACGGIQGPTAYVETTAIDGESNLKIKLPSYHAKPPVAVGGKPKPKSNDPNISSNNNKNSLEKVGGSSDERPSLSGAHRASIYDDWVIAVSTDKTKVHGASLINNAVFKTDTATEFINAFNGSILYNPSSPESTPVALSGSNLLLRGSVLRATEWCVGIVAFTGMETKIALNSKRVPSKLSSLDRVVNRTLLIAIIAMIIVCLISSLIGMLWDSENSGAAYLCLDENDQPSCESSSTNSTGLSIFTFATLYNNFVCISMYVSLEMIYLAQSFFISQDLTLYDATTDTPAEVHSSGLCADLGQVQYVLSDKTGTITKNVMKLRRCSIGGMVYGSPLLTASGGDKEPLPAPLSNSFSTNSLKSTIAGECEGVDYSPLMALGRFRSLPDGADRALIVDFLRVLTACNTVMLMPDAKTGELNVCDKASLESCLQAESADEVALVVAAVEYAQVLLSERDVRSVVVSGLVSASETGSKAWISRSTLDSKEISNGTRETTTAADINIAEPVRDAGTSVSAGAAVETYEVLAVNVFDSDR